MSPSWGRELDVSRPVSLLRDLPVHTSQDAYGRKAFFFLGPLANCLTSLLQIAYPTSIPVCFFQRIASQTLSTVSGSTIGTATLADVASGDKLTGALGAFGSWAGLGVIIGPLISGLLVRVFGVANQVRKCHHD